MDTQEQFRRIYEDARFSLGRLVLTANAEKKLDPRSWPEGLERHAQCDWGDLSDDDRTANEAALDDRTRLLSAYRDSQGIKYWIITEADRSATTVLLPEDY